MGFTASEAYNLPIWRRRWFIERTIKEINSKQQSRAVQDNDPHTRALLGKDRADGPTRTRRFT